MTADTTWSNLDRHPQWEWTRAEWKIAAISLRRPGQKLLTLRTILINHSALKSKTKCISDSDARASCMTVQHQASMNVLNNWSENDQRIVLFQRLLGKQMSTLSEDRRARRRQWWTTTSLNHSDKTARWWHSAANTKTCLVDTVRRSAITIQATSWLSPAPKTSRFMSRSGCSFKSHRCISEGCLLTNE